MSRVCASPPSFCEERFAILKRPSSGIELNDTAVEASNFILGIQRCPTVGRRMSGLRQLGSRQPRHGDDDFLTASIISPSAAKLNLSVDNLQKLSIALGAPAAQLMTLRTT